LFLDPEKEKIRRDKRRALIHPLLIRKIKNFGVFNFSKRLLAMYLKLFFFSKLKSERNP
jgi:hypothetical protein